MITQSPTSWPRSMPRARRSTPALAGCRAGLLFDTVPVGTPPRVVVLGDVAVPGGIPDLAVDQLPSEIGVAGMAECLGGHVNEHAMEGDWLVAHYGTAPGVSRSSASTVASAATQARR